MNPNSIRVHLSTSSVRGLSSCWLMVLTRGACAPRESLWRGHGPARGSRGPAFTLAASRHRLLCVSFLSFFFKFCLLEANCLTILYWFLPNITRANHPLCIFPGFANGQVRSLLAGVSGGLRTSPHCPS